MQQRQLVTGVYSNDALRTRARPQPQQAATVAASSTSPVPLLHRHALESVFAFCSLPGLTTAQLVSRNWHSAVRSMRPIEASVHLLTPAVLEWLRMHDLLDSYVVRARVL